MTFFPINLNVISPSIPGWGMSSKSAPKERVGNTLTSKHLIMNDAKDFMELMDSLKIDKFMLGGWSAGAQYALALATFNPKRIIKLGLFVPVAMYYEKCNPFATEIEANIRYFLGVKYIRDVMSMITANMITSSFMEQYIRPNDMDSMVWNSLKRAFCKSRNGLNIMSEYIISDWNEIDFDKVSSIGKILISSNLNDQANPPKMQKCLNQLIDGSVLITYENKSHHDVMLQTEELLTKLIEL